MHRVLRPGGLLGSQPVDLHPQAENILVVGSDTRYGGRCDRHRPGLSGLAGPPLSSFPGESRSYGRAGYR